MPYRIGKHGNIYHVHKHASGGRKTYKTKHAAKRAKRRRR